MSLSITSAFSLASLAAAGGAPTAAAAPPAQTAAESAPYVVKLTEAQQINQLNRQGDTVPQIADFLDLTVSAVNSYLGIANSA
jgi:DNA-binding NarL/FixJ family response regulator